MLFPLCCLAYINNPGLSILIEANIEQELTGGGTLGTAHFEELPTLLRDCFLSIYSIVFFCFRCSLNRV
jgi:hypothetical protein